MIRDFTDNAKAELEALILEVEDGRLSEFTDRLGDGWYGFESWLGRLNLEEDLSNVNAYHRKIIDKNNMTLQALEQIFSDVYSCESRYYSELSGLLDMCRTLNEYIGRLEGLISPGISPARRQQLLAGLKASLARLGYQSAGERLSELLTQIRGDGIETEEEKLQYISAFEAYYQGICRRMDTLLAVLDADQAREIRYIAYSAQEPYRSIYLAELGTYVIGLTGYTWDEGAQKWNTMGYFSTADNSINLTMAAEAANPRGPYTTFFHESGHAIDYNYQDDGRYYSITYRNEAGQSLQEVIYSDVRENIRETIATVTSDEEEQRHLMAYIMGADPDNTGSLSGRELACLTAIQKYYSQSLHGAAYEAASDVYGGVTNNIIHGNYGHWVQYENGATYWYSANGLANGMQSKELWAEYYSYMETGNVQAMENLRTYFPGAAGFLDEMAQTMVP